MNFSNKGIGLRNERQGNLRVIILHTERSREMENLSQYFAC